MHPLFLKRPHPPNRVYPYEAATRPVPGFQREHGLILEELARMELSHFGPEMGQSDGCETVRTTSRNPAEATTPTPENETVYFHNDPLASAPLLLILNLRHHVYNTEEQDTKANLNGSPQKRQH